MAARGRIVGYLTEVDQRKEGFDDFYGGAFPMPSATNFETLISESRSHGFSVLCLGQVHANSAGNNRQLVVALRGPASWEIFIGAHHRLERVAVEPKKSFDFGAGVFLTGRSLNGEEIHLLVPKNGHRDNLGILPTLNGEIVRRF